jgi:hypothetical protein
MDGRWTARGDAELGGKVFGLISSCARPLNLVGRLTCTGEPNLGCYLVAVPGPSIRILKRNRKDGQYWPLNVVIVFRPL